jgi:hypothetical protein
MLPAIPCLVGQVSYLRECKERYAKSQDDFACGTHDQIHSDRGLGNADKIFIVDQLEHFGRNCHRQTHVCMVSRRSVALIISDAR